MTVEAATHIADLVATNPVIGDQVAEGDDHIRLVKQVLKTDFAAITGAVTASHTELNQLTGKVPLTTTTAGQLVLMAATTISGAPAAVDFISGSGGVTISSAYSGFVILLDGITHGSSTNAKLRLDFSVNGGSTWAQGVAEGSVLKIDGTTVTSASISTAYFPIIGDHADASGTGGIYAEVTLNRNPGSTDFGSFSRYHGNHASVRRDGFVSAETVIASGFNAVRVYWDTGNFANTGTISFYGRKA